MNLKELRVHFPVTDKYIFLNNAAESPMNLPVRNAIDNFFDIACNAPQDKPDGRDDVRKRLAILLGGEPSDYALITSTGVGSGIVAAGYDFREGDNIVIPEYEHRNNLFPWIALRDRGVEVRFVPVEADGNIKLERIEELVDEKTKIISIAAVRFNSGFRADLKKISNIAHKKGALLFVDGIQAAGVVPINVEDMGIDLLSSAGFKWLLGVPGTGFLYVNPRIKHLIKPVIPGMFAAENHYDKLNYLPDSRRYETGSVAYSLFYGWVAGLDLLISIGIDNIFNRVIELTDLIIKGLKERNIEILSHIDSVSNRSSILFFTLGSEEENKNLEEKLKDKGVIISVRDGKCRISPSFYNTEEEIDNFFKILDEEIAFKTC